MLGNHDQNIESRFKLAQSMVLYKIARFIGQNLQGSIDQKLELIETRVDLIFCRNSNSAQAYMTCRVKCFTSSIKGKTLATF